jgi:hypothetical protein
MLEPFQLAHYRLTLHALEPLLLPPFKGSALRGGFGHTFKRLVCFKPGECGQTCGLGNDCPYGYVFETRPEAGAEVLRNLSEVPRPFIIQSPADRRTRIEPNQRLTFGLTLVGRGINYLAYFIMVFRELGRIGLGRSRGKFFLANIDAVQPLDGQTAPVYRASDDMIRSSQLKLEGADLTRHAAALPTDRITLEFLTPTRLKQDGKWVRHGPPFDVLIRTLLGRISSLSYFHCGQRLEVDFRGLIDRAAEVRIEQGETRWDDWSRFSGRQQQRVNMGGLVGRVTYAGDLADFGPLLALGEWIHVGKGTVFGNGQYRIRGAA